MRSSLRLCLSLAVSSLVLSGNVQASNPASSPVLPQTDQITRQEHQLELELFKIKAQINGLTSKQKTPVLAGLHQGGWAKSGDGIKIKPHTHLVPDKYSKNPSPGDLSFEHEANPLLGISPETDLKIHQAATNYMNGVTVITSPILGLKSAWTPTDLLYSVPSMNEDLRLLRDRDGFEKVLNEMGGSLDDRPLVVFSGGVEGAGIYTDNYLNDNSVNISLITAEIDVWPIISAWAGGFFSIDFDSSPPQTGTRTENSRLYLSRGFLNIGDLAKFPLYLTVGQMYIPFGRYASAMITSPLTLSLGRANERTVLLGLYKNGLYAEGYTFTGDRRSNGNRIILQSGFNVGYESPSVGSFAYDVGAGFVTNLGSSQGIEDNRLDPGNAIRAASTQFAGFSRTFVAAGVDSLNLRHNVGGLDIHSELTLGKYVLLTEFVTAATSFNAGDLAYRNHGAVPRALHVELDYNTKRGRIPYTFGIAYGQSWEALALNLPQQSFFLLLSTSIWKDTQLGIEYRHDNNYSVVPNASTGGGGNGNIANRLPVPGANVGGSRDMITMLLGVYF